MKPTTLALSPIRVPNINCYLVPPRLRRFRRVFGRRRFMLLDVGCGNESVFITKRWLPLCIYHGLEHPDAPLSAEQRSLIDVFFPCDLTHSDLSELTDNSYDLIIFSHVIEHLENGLEVLTRLTRKLAPGGHIYVEFPSVRSLALPSARGTLNFCDDPTHVRLYDIKEVANTLLQQRLTIVRASRRCEWSRVILSPLTFPAQIRTLLTEHRLNATGLWDLLGFADFVHARRRDRGSD